MTNRITNRIFFFRFFRYSNTESWTESNQRNFSNRIRIRIEYYIFLKTESAYEPNLSFVDISESDSDPIWLLKDKPNMNRTRIRISQKSLIRIRNRFCFLYIFANLWFGLRIIWFVDHCFYSNNSLLQGVILNQFSYKQPQCHAGSSANPYVEAWNAEFLSDFDLFQTGCWRGWKFAWIIVAMGLIDNKKNIYCPSIAIYLFSEFLLWHSLKVKQPLINRYSL